MAVFQQSIDHHQATPTNQDGNTLANGLIAIALAIPMIAVPVFAHIINPIFAIVLCLLVAGTMARYLPGAAVVAVVFAAMFQNLFVSIVSPHIDDPSDLNVIRGYSFFILVAVWSVTFTLFIVRYREHLQTLDKFVRISLGLMLLVFGYFLIGAISNPIGAVIYLRSIATSLLIFQLCLILFAILPLKITHAFKFITFILILCGYTELLFREDWLYLTNGETLFNLMTQSERSNLAWDKSAAETGIVVKGFIDSITVDFFNTPLLADLKIKIARLLGPNNHPISYAYAVSFFILFSVAIGSFISAILLVPLLLFANAKGAIILLILVWFAWGMAKLFGARFALITLGFVLSAYILIGIQVGLFIGDFHVLGFMGGVYNFAGNPIGHGIGAGGNLAVKFKALDWSEYQAIGRTPIAVESAIGVMLYQMGIAAFAYIGFVIWIACKTVMIGRSTGQSIHLIAGFGLLVILANGVFQEEALFSPHGFGFLMALNGIIIGSSIRTGLMK